MPRFHLLVALFSVTLFIALGAALALRGRSGSAGTRVSTSSPTRAPTLAAEAPPASMVNNTAVDAIRHCLALVDDPSLGAGPVRVRSVQYVETTSVAAFGVVGPPPLGSDLPPDSAVWLILASGQFYARPVPGSLATPVSFSSAWFVAIKGHDACLPGGTNESYDLSGLGRVVTVPRSDWGDFAPSTSISAGGGAHTSATP